MCTKKTLLMIFLALIWGVASNGFAQSVDTAAPGTHESPAENVQTKPISAAETLVFLGNHLKHLPKSAVVDYSFQRKGSLGDNFSDKVTLSIREGKTEQGKIGNVAFLTGKHNIALPEVSNLIGNPVVLYFLERDIREMEKVTQGKQNFFRRRIRLALSDTNELKPVTIEYQGKTLQADEVSIQPYLNDPVKARFEKYEKKTYIFTVSDKVPGGIYSLRTSVPAPDGNQDNPLVEETLTFIKVRK